MARNHVPQILDIVAIIVSEHCNHTCFCLAYLFIIFIYIFDHHTTPIVFPYITDVRKETILILTLPPNPVHVMYKGSLQILSKEHGAILQLSTTFLFSVSGCHCGQSLPLWLRLIIWHAWNCCDEESCNFSYIFIPVIIISTLGKGQMYQVTCI